MVTLKDVGELAGVTATTASAALRGKRPLLPSPQCRVGIRPHGFLQHSWSKTANSGLKL